MSAERVELLVGGMTCSSCSARIEKKLNRMPGVEASAWHALFLPKGTPAEIVQRLSEATSAALDNPKVQAQLATQGAIIPAPDRRSPGQARAFVKSEIERWGRTIRAMKIELN